MSTDPKLTQTLGNIQTLALGFKIVPIYTTVQWRIGDWKYRVGVQKWVYQYVTFVDDSFVRREIRNDLKVKKSNGAPRKCIL